MILDEKGKLFGVISLLDLAVILFLAFAVGTGIYQASTVPDTPSVPQTEGRTMQPDDRLGKAEK